MWTYARVCDYVAIGIAAIGIVWAFVAHAAR